MDVAKRFFAPAEQRTLLAARTEEERDILFSRLWTLKESYLKVGGQGMAMALGSFAITLGGQPVLDGTKESQYCFLYRATAPPYACSAGKQGRVRRFFSLFKTWKIWYDTDRV